MKPKDLKCPFSWEERRPLLLDRVLYVPDYYAHHQEWEQPPFHHPNFFGNHHPVFLEYCSGNGPWIAHRAESNPKSNWIAVDYLFERVRKIWSKIKNRGLENLVVVSGEALTFSRFYLPQASLEGVFMNFPDPWPKQKHAKNRLVQAPFVEELARTVKPGGKAVFVTDDETYAGQILCSMRAHRAWSPSFPAPYYITEWPGYGTSFFEELWRKKGKTIHYFQFERKE